MHSRRTENFSLRGDATVSNVQPPKKFDYLSLFHKNIDGRVDLGSIEEWNDQESSWPAEKVRVD